MIFDARPEARVIFKERLLWLLFLGPFFFLTYGTANQLTALYPSLASIMFDWEHAIPFIPEMIVPYMSVDLLFGFSFLLVSTRDEIQRHALRLGFTIAFAVVLFLLIPLQFSLDKPMVEGWAKPIFSGLAADLPYNQIPSLHVSLSMVVGYIYFMHLKGFWRWFSVFWFSLIAVSTLFVYQHHFIDLPTGFMAGLLTFYLIPAKGKTWPPLRFVSPKHIYIALRYLIVSILFTVLAFKTEYLVWLSAWIALSLLILAGLYMLGINDISNKKRGQIQRFSWLLFWPYLLGNYIAWHLWKKKVPAMVEIANGIWIGRSLNKKDEALIQKNKIKTIIDLAPEVNNVIPETVSYIYQPLLDLAIPDPIELQQICAIISAEKQQGNIYVHCKFGLSRSVLVGCAWLITQGFTKQQAWDAVSKAQTMRVDRPYMHIALELFEAHYRKH
ncbi:MAG: hypothetical protein COA95_11640 [Methylophaga sp.]|nr:MAG: hypothetical protein COA95_11640 [Methylophaga sp.]